MHYNKMTTSIYLTTDHQLMSSGAALINADGTSRAKLQSCVSIVVDDVDGGDVDCCPSCYSPADDAECNCHHHHHHQFVLNCLNQSQSSSSVDAAAADSNDAAATAAVLFGVGDACDDNSCDARSDAGSTRSSRGSTSREENENRLQQIKDEVRHRRDEFARLLDEHEQVVKELRRIESAGELQQQVATNADGVIKPITE